VKAPAPPLSLGGDLIYLSLPSVVFYIQLVNVSSTPANGPISAYLSLTGVG
jgi:hypothetical protein